MGAPQPPASSFEDAAKAVRHLRGARAAAVALLTAARTAPADAAAIGIPAHCAGAEGGAALKTALFTAPDGRSHSGRDGARAGLGSADPKGAPANAPANDASPLFAVRAVRAQYQSARQRAILAAARPAPSRTFDPAVPLADVLSHLHPSHPLRRTAVHLSEWLDDHVARLWTAHRAYEAAEAEMEAEREAERASRAGGFTAIAGRPSVDDFVFPAYGRYGGVEEHKTGPPNGGVAEPADASRTPAAKAAGTPASRATRTPRTSRKSKVANHALRPGVPTLGSLAAAAVGELCARRSISASVTLDDTPASSPTSASASDESPSNLVSISVPAEDDVVFYSRIPFLHRRDVLLSHALHLALAHAPLPALIASVLRTCQRAGYLPGARACLSRLAAIREGGSRSALEFWKWFIPSARTAGWADSALAAALADSQHASYDPAESPPGGRLRAERLAASEELSDGEAVRFAAAAFEMVLAGMEGTVDVHPSHLSAAEALSATIVSRSVSAADAPEPAQASARAVLTAALAASLSKACKNEAPQAVLLVCMHALRLCSDFGYPVPPSLSQALRDPSVESADPAPLLDAHAARPELLLRLASTALREGCHGAAYRPLQHLAATGADLVRELAECERGLEGAGRARWKFDPLVGSYVPATPAVVRRVAPESESESEAEERARKPRKPAGARRKAAAEDDSEDEVVRFRRPETESEGSDEESGSERSNRSDETDGSESDGSSSDEDASSHSDRDSDSTVPLAARLRSGLCVTPAAEAAGRKLVGKVTRSMGKLSVGKRARQSSSSSSSSGSDSGRQKAEQESSGSEAPTPRRTLKRRKRSPSPSSSSSSEDEIAALPARRPLAPRAAGRPAAMRVFVRGGKENSPTGKVNAAFRVAAVPKFPLAGEYDSDADPLAM